MHQRVLDEVKLRWQQATWSNSVAVSFCQIPAGDFALPMKAYDKVLALHLFVRSAEIRSTLRICRKALKPGGIFYTTAIGHDHMKELWDLARQLDPQIHFYNLDSLDQFSVETGGALLNEFFDEVSWRPFHTHIETEDVAVLTEYLWASYSNIQTVLEGRKDRLAAHIKKRLKGKPLYISENTGIFVCR